MAGKSIRDACYIEYIERRAACGESVAATVMLADLKEAKAIPESLPHAAPATSILASKSAQSSFVSATFTAFKRMRHCRRAASSSSASKMNPMCTNIINGDSRGAAANSSTFWDA